MKFNNCIALVCLVLLAGCFNQAPDKVEKKSSFGNKFEAQKKKCSEVDFHHDFFRHKNIMSTFECLGWNEEYPLFTKFLSQQESGFDGFATDVNHKFFGSKAKEARFYQLLKRVNNEKFISDTHTLLEIMAQADRAEIFSELIEKSGNAEWAVNDFFLPVLSFFFAAKQHVRDNTKLLDHSEFFRDPKMQKALTAISAELLASVANRQLRAQLVRFTYEKEKSWPVSYVHALEGDDIVAMNSMFMKDYKKLASDIDSVSNFITRPSNCQVAGRWAQINHAQEMYDSTRKFIGSSPDAMMWDLAELIQKFAIYENICEKTASQKRYIKATQGVLRKIVDSILQKGSIEFMTRLIELKLTKNPLSSVEFLKFFSGTFFKNYQSIAAELEAQGQTIVFNDVLDMLKRMHPSDFEKMSKIIQVLGTELEKNKQLMKFMQQHHKFLLMDFFTELMINKLDFGGRSRELLELVNFMPDTASDRVYLAKFMKALVAELANPQFKDEMKRFMSRKSLYQFTGLMGTSREVKLKAAPVLKVQNPYELASELLDPTCVKTIRNIKVIDFDSLVQSGIYKCAPRNKDYYFYHVYEWTAQLDNYFLQQHGHKFSLNYGVVSPEMMGLYLGMVMIAKDHLYRPDGLYVRDAIASVRKALYDGGFLSLLNNGLTTLAMADKKLKLMKGLTQVLESQVKSKRISNQRIREVMELATSKAPAVPNMNPLCKDLTPKISMLGCLNGLMVNTYFRDISRLLIENHQYNTSMLDYLLDAFYDSGISLPVLSDKGSKYTISFAEFIDFYNHLSSDSTKQLVTYHTGKDASISTHLTMSERLEIVIRDIGFNNNFYGLYFMNSGAQAENYIEEMISMRKRLGMLTSGGGIMRFFDVLDEESKYKFKNVEATYQSLIDVRGPYRNGYGNSHSYVKLIQALMGAAVKASPKDTTDFHPYRPPSFDKVKGHKGNLITRVAELSLVTRIGKLLKRMDSRVTLDRTNRLNALGEAFKRRLPKAKLKEFLVYVLSHKHAIEVVTDLYKLQEKMRPGEVVSLFNIIADMTQDFVGHSKNPLQMLELTKRLLDNYPKIKANFSRLPSLLELVNIPKMEQMVAHEWTRKLLIELTDELTRDSNSLIGALLDPAFTGQLVDTVLVGQSTKLGFETETLNKIVLDSRVDWMIMVNMLTEVKNSKIGVKYLEDLLIQMARKNAKGQSGLEFAAKTIFSEPKALEIFLQDAFRKVKML